MDIIAAAYADPPLWRDTAALDFASIVIRDIAALAVPSTVYALYCDVARMPHSTSYATLEAADAALKHMVSEEGVLAGQFEPLSFVETVGGFPPGVEITHGAYRSGVKEPGDVAPHFGCRVWPRYAAKIDAKAAAARRNLPCLCLLAGGSVGTVGVMEVNVQL